MSYTYATYTAALAELMVTPVGDPNFVAIEPSIIDYAEQRIYRELDLLGTNITDATATLTASNRNFTLPSGQGTFIVVDYINVLTPVGSTAANGTRTPLIPMSRDTIDVIYPSGQTATGVPQYFGMIDPGTVMLAPSPNAAYATEVIGTIRPAPLSSTNTTTILTSYVPDLFMAASMVFASGYMRNFGSQADDPRMSQSWESHYQLLKVSAQNRPASGLKAGDGRPEIRKKKPQSRELKTCQLQTVAVLFFQQLARTCQRGAVILITTLRTLRRCLARY